MLVKNRLIFLPCCLQVWKHFFWGWWRRSAINFIITTALIVVIVFIINTIIIIVVVIFLVNFIIFFRFLTSKSNIHVGIDEMYEIADGWNVRNWSQNWQAKRSLLCCTVISFRWMKRMKLACNKYWNYYAENRLFWVRAFLILRWLRCAWYVLKCLRYQLWN